MVTGERLTLTVTGGAPWGFRLQGGGSYPLEVAKVSASSFIHADDKSFSLLILLITTK